MKKSQINILFQNLIDEWKSSFPKEYQIFESKKLNKQLLSEIKMIPSNRILLQRYKDYKYYFFKVENEKFTIWAWDLQNYEIKFWDNLDILKSFLDKKRIPYEIKKDKWGDVIYINPKYFVVPDKLNEIKLLKHPNLPLINTSKIKTIYDLIYWKNKLPSSYQIMDMFPDNFPMDIKRKIREEWYDKNKEIIDNFTPDFLEEMYNKHHDEELEFDGKVSSPLRNKKYSIIDKLVYSLDLGKQKILNSIMNYLGIKIIDFYNIYIWDEYYRLKLINLYMFYYNNIPLIYIPKLQYLDNNYVGIYSPNGYISINGLSSIMKNNNWNYFKEILELNNPINEVKLIPEKKYEEIYYTFLYGFTKLDSDGTNYLLSIIFPKYKLSSDFYNEFPSLPIKDFNNLHKDIVDLFSSKNLPILDKKKWTKLNFPNSFSDKEKENTNFSKSSKSQPKPKTFTKQWWNNLWKEE